MSTQDRIKVLARIRPLNSREIARDDAGGIQAINGGQCIQLEHSTGASSGRRFVLDAVLDEKTSQHEVFVEIEPLLENSIQGYNTTIFTCEIITFYWLLPHNSYGFRWTNGNRKNIYNAWL